MEIHTEYCDLLGEATESIINSGNTSHKNNEQDIDNPLTNLEYEHFNATLLTGRNELLRIAAEYDGSIPTRRPKLPKERKMI